MEQQTIEMQNTSGDVVVYVDNNFECPICFEMGKPYLPLTCAYQHKFCVACLTKYYGRLIVENQTLQCPLCRGEVLSNTCQSYINIRNKIVSATQQHQMSVVRATPITNVVPITPQSPVMHFGRTSRFHVNVDEYKFERSIMIILLVALVFALLIVLAISIKQ